MVQCLSTFFFLFYWKTCIHTSYKTDAYCRITSFVHNYIYIHTTLTPQIKGNHRVIYQLLYLDITLWLGQYHDIALTTTAFDAEAATKHQFPLIIYIEMLKVCIVGLN